MCDHEDLYTYSPPFVIGGATGNYKVTAPVTSGRWVEYSIVAVTKGGTASGGAYAIISGDSAPKPLTLDGTVVLNEDGTGINVLSGIVMWVPDYSTTIFDTRFIRITHSQKQLYAYINCAVGNGVFVTVQFRTRLLDVVPGPSTTVHPDHAHQLNIARADATNARLGPTKEIAKGEGLNAQR